MNDLLEIEIKDGLRRAEPGLGSLIESAFAPIHERSALQKIVGRGKTLDSFMESLDPETGVDRGEDPLSLSAVVSTGFNRTSWLRVQYSAESTARKSSNNDGTATSAVDTTEPAGASVLGSLVCWVRERVSGGKGSQIDVKSRLTKSPADVLREKVTEFAARIGLSEKLQQLKEKVVECAEKVKIFIFDFIKDPFQAIKSLVMPKEDVKRTESPDDSTFLAKKNIFQGVPGKIENASSKRYKPHGKIELGLERLMEDFDKSSCCRHKEIDLNLEQKGVSEEERKPANYVEFKTEIIFQDGKFIELLMRRGCNGNWNTSAASEITSLVSD